MKPFEVVAAPFTIYVAPVGTAFPAVHAAPAVTWFRLGTSGDKNYHEDGVVVTHEQEIEVWRALGSTGPRKAWRTEEALMIGFTLVDLSSAQYAKILGDVAVTQTAPAVGVPGSDEFSLLRRHDVKALALLARGDVSPAGDAFKTQYQVPVVFENGSQEVTFQKGEPGGLECEWMAIEDATDGFGKLKIQTAAAL